MLARMATAGLCAALVLGHATATTAMLQLSNTVIAIGGEGDTTSARVRNKLDDTVVPAGFGYYGVPYPATDELTESSNVAVPLVNTYVTETGKAEQSLIVAGYSEGTLAAEQERRNLQALPASSAPPKDQLSFEMIASPFAPNGGIFGRFPGISIPFVVNAMGAAQPSRYDTTYSALMYDPYADFPAYFNPLALLNSALAVEYAHPDPFYDPLDPASSPRYVTTVSNAAGGTDTYVLYYNEHLPLFAPLRQLSAMAGTTAFTEPLISAIEPLARVLVDMGYTDRVNANPAAVVPFSLITPPQKIVEAVLAIPGALTQGAENLLAGGQTTATPPNPIGNLQEGPTDPPVPAAVRDVAPTSTSTSTQAKPKPKRHQSTSAAGPRHPSKMSKANKLTRGKARKPKSPAAA
jgi:PE-PPE domain-containing protein